LLDAFEREIGKTTTVELVRTEGQLYLTVGGATIEGSIEKLTPTDD
jgi:hypothetical protein